MYKLSFFVPESHVDSVKAAIFEAGAGKQGDYDQCAWQTRGEGQFRPLEGADPFLGESGSLEKVPEYRVETLCPEEHARAIIAALRLAHPYEEPAFDLIPLVDPDSLA